MKQTTILALVLAGLSLATAAQASTISLSPATASVAAGQTLTVTVSVNAQTSNDAMAQVELSYPTDLLEETSFTYAPAWLPLTQSGYDGVSGGIVTKTAGYPGGFTGTQAFGTVTFKAIKAGTATLAFGGGSEIIDGQGSDALTGTSGGTVAITAPAAATAQPAASVTAATPAPSNTNPAINQAAAAADAVVSSSASSSTVNAANQAAAVAASSFSIPLWIWALLALVVAAVLGSWWKWGKKAQQ